MAVAGLSTCDVLGVRCFAGDVEGAAARVLARVREGRGGYVCLANAHLLVTGKHDLRVQKALDDAWMVCPDGWPVAWVGRRLGAHNASRIAGADLMAQVFESGQTKGIRHFLFGSTPNVLAALEHALSVAHPRAEIVGTFSPPFWEPTDEEAWEHVERIRKIAPDVVWCALGAPKQELWMRRHARSLAPAVLVGVGAAFDFHAGTKTRAPVWMQQAGLEWLHRLKSEPRRLASRYAWTNSEFLVRAATGIATHRRR